MAYAFFCDLPLFVEIAAMTPAAWKELCKVLVNTDELTSSLKAAKSISKNAGPVHVSDLYELLNSDNFYVREAVSVPLARLEGAKALPQLFVALQRGEQQGHDNDGLVNTLIGLLESNQSESLPYLLKLLKSDVAEDRMNAVWAMGFLAPAFEPEILFKVFESDPDEEVRQSAGDALMGFLGTGADQPTRTPDAFDGKWMWVDCEPHLKYGFEVKGAQGIALVTNSPAFKVGDVILKIGLHSSHAFVGEHLFTNWTWYPVNARRDGRKLYFQGGGQIWHLEQID